MLIKFLFIFTCLCATSSFAKMEVIVPTSIGTEDQWDSTGGPNKPILITDQTEGTYIIAATANLKDRYNIGDLIANDIDVIDSVVVHYRARESATGNNQITLSIFIDTDEQTGPTADLSTTWTNYRHRFVNPPGAGRGTWDDFEVDSIVVRFNASAVENVAWITECSVQVFYSSNDRTLMFPEKDDACLSVLGSLFDHDLLRKSAMQNDTAFIRVAAGGVTPPSFWKTGDALTIYHEMNHNDWGTGGLGVFFTAVHVKSDCSLRVRAQRYNSSCVLQESTPWYPASGAKLLVDTTGSYEFQIPQHDWTAGACGDELAIHFEWSNPSGEPEDSVWILYGVAGTYLEHEILFPDIGGACGLTRPGGDCAGQSTTDNLTLTPNDSGPINQFVNVGGAGNKILAIADATDVNYMMEDAAGQAQNVGVTAFTEPNNFVSYDSVHIEFRAKRNTLAPSKRVRLRTRLEQISNTNFFCENTYSNIKSINWSDFNGNKELTIYGAPSGYNTCEGTLDEAAIEGMSILFRTVQLSTDFECHITKVDMIVCYTKTASEEQNFRRIRMIKMGSVDDKTIWDTYFDQELVIKDEYETSVTFGFPSQRWVWSQ